VKEGKMGRFRDTIEKLDYLVTLGINCHRADADQRVPGEQGWGYNPRYLFAVEKSYGTPDDLCALVDECHARGIRVILDGVYNHSEVATPLAQIDHNYWYYRPDHGRARPAVRAEVQLRVLRRGVGLLAGAPVPLDAILLLDDAFSTLTASASTRPRSSRTWTC